MLAVARLGAVHICRSLAVSRQPLCEIALLTQKPKCPLRLDGNLRGGKYINLKKWADEAVVETPTIERVVVVRRLETMMCLCKLVAISTGDELGTNIPGGYICAVRADG